MNKIIKGTFILTISGVISKLIAFYYRIFLNNTIGTTGVGIYQMVLPVIGLFSAVCTSGVEIAMSKNISKSTSSIEIRNNYRAGTIFAFLSSILSALIMFILLPFFINFYVLSDNSISIFYLCIPLLPLMSFHSCISGYYLGLKRPFIPGMSICLETLFKLGFMYGIKLYFKNRGISPTPFHAVLSLLLSEALSVLILYIIIKCEFIGKSNNHLPFFKLPVKSFSIIALPISCTRVLLSLIHSIEAICVPLFLTKSGLTSDGAISIFGIVTGLSMPFILFPMALTTALSSMLLPSISESLRDDNTDTINITASKTLKYCMFMGIFATGFFLIFGDLISRLFFDNILVGAFLKKLAFLCPFIYVEITLSSIINGFGLTKITLLYNILSATLRTLLIIILVPFIGIDGYFIAILFAEILGTSLTVLKVSKLCTLSYSVTDNIIKPVLASSLILVCMKYLINIFVIIF